MQGRFGHYLLHAEAFRTLPLPESWIVSEITPGRKGCFEHYTPLVGGVVPDPANRIFAWFTGFVTGYTTLSFYPGFPLPAGR